jgi:5-methylcytosine-specific restriction endonuclease McrA
MRRAISVRDKECPTEGCDRPAAWCEVHHQVPFSHGGATNVADGRLLCPRHHHHAHDSRYDLRMLPDGQVRFHRKT